LETLNPAGILTPPTFVGWEKLREIVANAKYGSPTDRGPLMTALESLLEVDSWPQRFWVLKLSLRLHLAFLSFDLQPQKGAP
jgi:hypothetical protein